MRASAVKARGLLKEYHIYDHPLERLREVFLKRARHKVFRALGPLDLEVYKGETFGIVGENGAGKSTFLKLAAGVIEPTSGSIETTGKISSILELGTGFNPEFTGRENVTLNGALLGLSPAEINARMDRIIRFADIGEFFDIPVKTYSSGMYLRLAFALAVHVDADMLVVDEALSVGDGAYEKKCIDKMWELKNKGVTILYCSHSLYTVTNFCDRAMWLRAGRIEGIGDTKWVVSQYEDYLREKERLEGTEGNEAGELNREGQARVARVTDIVLRADGHPVEDSMEHAADLDVVVSFEVFEDTDVYLGFAVDRNDGLGCFADTMLKQGIKPFHGPGIFETGILFKNVALLGGAYKVVIFLLDETGICVFDRRESSLFKVITKEKEWGVFRLPYEWRR